MANNTGSLSAYFSEIRKYPLIDVQEEIELSKRIKEGDSEAFELFVNANLRLVAVIAKDYRGMGLALEDLIGEGNVGLMNAVRKFDPEKGAKFSTYAAHWIKSRMRLAVKEKSRDIRVPAGALNKYHLVKGHKLRLEEELKREPTIEELENELVARGISKRFIRRILQDESALKETISLDKKVFEGSKNLYSDFIEDENAENPLSKLAKKDFRGLSLSENLDILGKRERYIIEMRYGLDGEGSRTLEQISLDLGITRERVRQIEKQSLKNLREHLKQKDSYLEDSYSK